MSEAGWRAFLDADGLDDWVVLHGGATAVYRLSSAASAARLAVAIVASDGWEGGETLLTIAGDRLSVRLSRDLWSLGPAHVARARTVSTIAGAHAAVADRSAVQEVQLAVAARPDAIDVGFWRAVLGYEPMAEDNAVDPLGHGSTVWMQELDAGRPLRHAMHVDVSVAREHVQGRVAAALAAGGRIVAVSEEPGHWTLSDRAGNRVCVTAWPDGAPAPEPAERL